MPKISPHQISQSVTFGGNSKLVTLTFPVIEKSSDRFAPNYIQLGDRVANPELVANIDAMARKNLQDEMPAYVLRATSRALVSLAAQYAADQAAQQAARKNNQNNQNSNAAIIGAIAGMLTGYGLQAINVTDVRHWSTLPAQTYMARMGLPIGATVLKFALPSGVIQSQTVNLVGGYNVIYIRMFRNKATVLTSNDPAALPLPPQVLAPQTISNPVSTVPRAASDEVKSKEGGLDGFKKLFSGFMGPKPEEATLSAPVLAAPVEPESAAAVPAVNPPPKPASGNMDGLKPYEPPSLLNSLQQLFN